MAPVAATAEVRDGLLGHDECAGQIHVEHLPPQFERAVFDAAPFERTAGVVDEDVQPARGRDKFPDEGSGLRCVAQVRRQHDAVATVRTNQFQRLIRPVGAPVAMQPDERAGRRQRFGNRAPDANARTGDERRPAMQISPMCGESGFHEERT